MSFKDHLYKKYAILKSYIEIEHELDENEIVWQNLTEDDNYDELLTSLSQCEFLTLEMLDDLMKINYIDTRHSNWIDISQKLQECFSSNSYNLFLKSLKIHYKMLMTQNGCIDGYLSLLKATNRIANNCLEKFKGENFALNNRILLCIEVILCSELSILKTVHAGSDKILEEIVDNLFLLFSSETYIQDKVVPLLDFISCIDEKAEWFKYLCLSGFTKSYILEKLSKYPTISGYIFKKFFKPLNDILSSINNDSEKSIYTHSCHFLIYFFSIHENISKFELKIHDNNTYNFLQLLTLIIHTVNNHISSEVRESLKNFIILLFQMNPSLISRDILELMFKPFEDVMRDNSMNVINKYSYLFTIIQLVVENNEKILTDGYLYNRRKYRAIFNFGQSGRDIVSANRNSVNLPQLIIDMTISMMRNYINNSEKKHSVNANTLLLLECSEKIYNSHPVFLYNGLTSKFIVNLASFYKVLNNFPTTKKEIEKVLSMFNFFFKYHSNIFNLLKDKIFITGVLNSVISNKIEVSSFMIFDNISNEISIADDLQIQLHLVAQSFLLSACSQETGDQTIENILEKESFMELLQFLHGISYSTKLIKMLLSQCPNFDFVMKGVIPIMNLLKLSIQSVRNTLDTYIGLLLMRILMSNLDGLVILQEKYGLKENALKVLNLVSCDSDCEDESATLDACSIVRKNLTMCIDYIGCPNRRLNALDDSHCLHNSSETKILGPKTPLNSDMQKFLLNTRSALHDQTWMNQVKSYFYTFCSKGYKVGLVYEIISQCPKKEKISKSWPESGTSLPSLHKEDFIAIPIVVRYGLQNQLLTPGYRHEDNLAQLVKQSRVFLEEESEEFDGFDWFIAVCFLICSGNMERCKNFCISMSQLPCVNLVWFRYGRKFGSLWLENYFQHLNVLMAENTILYTALKMASLNPTMIVGKCLGQCFFNILDFREICNFITFLVLSPLECSIYYMLCLFIHNKNGICLMTHNLSLTSLLNVTSLEDFKLTSYLPKINELSARYKNIIKL